jgi:hypothetical protein
MHFGTYLLDKSSIEVRNIPNKECKEKSNIHYICNVLFLRSAVPEINNQLYVCLISYIFNAQHGPFEEGDNYRKTSVFRTHTNIAMCPTYLQIAHVQYLHLSLLWL